MYNQLYERRKRNKRKVSSSKWKEQPIKKEKYVEIDYTLDGSVKQLFLNLTKMQIPFDYEQTLEPFFPKGMLKDEHDNYYIKVGESKTMFCGHLDTYCNEYKRVWHILKGNIIKTDGTTTLGGDDKAGIVIMIKMIEAGIPGLYYFFRGEEGVTSPSGTWGSRQALKTRGDFFDDYDKCIAFDRRGNSSIISEQMYQECCSTEFVDALSKEFSANGLDYKGDDTGMWCDSGVFMEIIPECTNISVGYKSEHTFNEEQDIEHLEKLVNACINIDWEKLPVKRDPDDFTASVGKYKYDYSYQKYAKKTGRTYPTKSYTNNDRDYVTMDDMFYHVCDILSQLNYQCLNIDDFDEVNEMYFTNYETGDFFGLRIIDYEIYISEDDTLKTYMNLGDLENFRRYVMTGVDLDDYDDTQYTEYSDLDREMDRRLGMSDDDWEPKKSKSESKSKYSKLQNDIFIDFVMKKPEITKELMNFLSKATILELSGNMWLKIDKAMVDQGYKMDYTEHGNNITPDDFMLWVLDNWNHVNNIISEKDKSKKNDVDKIKSNNRFLISLDDNVIDTNKYHFDEYQIFSKLVVDEPELVKLVLKDFEIQGKLEVRTETIKKIWDEITKIDYKRSDKRPLTAYPELFLKWLHDHKKYVKKFYNM